MAREESADGRGFRSLKEGFSRVRRKPAAARRAMVSFARMPARTLKRGLFRLLGDRGYRLLHGAWFLARLLAALALPPLRPGFFGRDMLALAARLKPGDTVLDVGAYLGGTAVLFALRVGPAGRIIAFEPVHHAFLSLLVRALRLPVQVVPAALGAEGGRAELVVPVHEGVPVYSQAGFAESYDTDALERRGAYRFRRLAARKDRLDDFLAREGLAPRSVAAVKIDVEGAERDVLEGGERFFRDFAGPLVCEFWFDAMPPEGWTWLRERGWSCRKLGPAGWAGGDTRGDLEALARGETYGNFWWEKPAPPPRPPASA
jgi:FkbM family methyltransferase